MTERQVDERIRRGFSGLTRPPRPQLNERIRDSLWGGPATVSPYALPPRLAALVAGLLLLALVAALLEGPTAVQAAGAMERGVNATLSRAISPQRSAATPPARRPAPAAVASASATPSVTPSATPSAVPSETPTPTAAATPTPAAAGPPPTAPVATLPGFSCAAQTGGGGQSTMSTARVGVQSGYDRFVIQFTGPVPQFEVTLQDSASFASVTLLGGAGLQVVLHNASGAGAYTGPTDMKPGFSEIQEARLLSDAQGVVQWGVGIAHPACFHAWTLSGPSRLVVDVAA